MKRVKVRPALLALSVLTALCCSSCGQGKPYYPVRGKVLVDGQPAEGVLIVFHPLDDAGPSPVQPSAVVQADGSFTLQSFLVEERILKDGAQAGKYQVTCTWYPADLQKYLGMENLPDKLHGKYANLKTSTLEAEIGAQPTELPPFQLQATKE